jgi:hypothetical protein
MSREDTMPKKSPRNPRTGARRPGVKNLAARKASADVKGGALNAYFASVQGEKQGLGPKK